MRDKKKNKTKPVQETAAAPAVPSAPSSDETASPRPASRRTLIITILVLLIAVCVVSAILLRNQHLIQELTDLRSSLKQSQDNWQQIAAEKEALQSELAEVEENIREAKLTYEESTAKIADLTEQVDTLTLQNASLETQLTLASEAETMYMRQTDEITDVLSQMQSSGDALSEEIHSGSEYTGDLWSAMFDARNDLLASLKARKKALEENIASSQAVLDSLADSGMDKKKDDLRAEIQGLEEQLQAVVEQIRKYGTENDLNE